MGENIVSTLRWGKPAKIMTDAEWRAISCDGGPPGACTPNMSAEDMLAWKARMIGGKNPRVEIRKTAGAQILITVTDASVRMSANGKMAFGEAEWRQLFIAVAEARFALEKERRRKC